MIAIILDAHLASALAAARSFGQKGIKTACGSPRQTALSFYSKYCSERFIYTSPRLDKDKFINDLLSFLNILKARGERAVLYSFSDETFLPLSESRDQWSSFADFALAEEQSIDTAFNKEKTLRLAELIGVPLPKTYFVAGSEEAKSLAPSLAYPAVIKPRHSCFWTGSKGQFGSTVFVDSKEDLIKKYSEIEAVMGEPPLVQEAISGEEYGIFFLFDHGEPVARFAHRRLRSISPSGGASVLRESIAIPKEMEEYSLRLLKALKWHGPAMVEFKRDERDGAPKLMEINGRFWGSLPLAIYAGVDFPYLYYRLATGGKIETAGAYRENIRSRHLLADVKNLITVLVGKGKRPGVVQVSRWLALTNFFKLGDKNLYYDVESLSDPKPFFAELVDAILKPKK